ncbi:uncharacterized protein LOC6567564 [Drosophila grimshawi]|uniref:GH17312 n=1 Tax=Drosophila grimshawi TaxID=7222 RepID=B4JSY0_DROGR|nr:uncharacterized protein LOC6567564 [Drosophila grimshawi]EDV94870.1 GH17312 [Drosophila grimshawi]
MWQLTLRLQQLLQLLLLLVILLLVQLGFAPAIVVERNMFAYYKVPLRMLHLSNTSSTSGLYYVLQCPPKLDDSIPKPKDMPTCHVVDQFKDIWQSKRKPKRLPTRTMLMPLPPPAVQRMRWGWRRPKRQNLDTGLPYDEATPLQHLGQPHRHQKLLKLAADHRKLKRGSRTKGYQHMFHRDESYNDHIFYDEMKLDGKFLNRGKTND